jgi:hypothetical protein
LSVIMLHLPGGYPVKSTRSRSIGSIEYVNSIAGSIFKPIAR